MIEISRIEKNLASDAFLARVFSPEEIEKFHDHWKAENMAARFCAKEALIKVFGRFVPMNEINVSNDAQGRPYYILTGEAEKVRRELNIQEIDLSLSHCRDYAVAFAVGRCEEEREV